jgi:hypothetical protein
MKIRDVNLTIKGRQALESIAREYYTTAELLGAYEIPISPSEIKSDLERRLVDLAMLPGYRDKTISAAAADVQPVLPTDQAAEDSASVSQPAPQPSKKSASKSRARRASRK